MDRYKLLLAVGIGSIGIIAIVITMDISKIAIATQDYDIYVDPLLDEQNLFVMGRVTIQNTGHKTLTNIKVNFGGGDVLELGSLNAGKKVIVSPPPDNEMKYVIVTADNDIFVNKAYRTPPKMVGMMGS
ncbi:MAG: hypothetical protein DWQ18_04115 [Crenarchaeota archaeon]|mgnify:CR=1 FL=1|nr:MAG: hypothetical protein DWQ17_09015 [Thermoproteota archaeon]RDJ34094.1 MAG: hypothetical protein DWQ18_04115 [Thermoproteota archaeon]RDJ36790.1 MAG: hypothetical protein DWQ13_06495 [Thermoproteota archaeon]RDJ37676.1 MAG: hypothetical protein DWQ19_04340 [Thermoproteota archaeon]